MIRAFWFSSNNFGDALNVYLVRKITGAEPAHADASDERPKFMICGSILGHATSTTTVWGAGVGAMAETVDPAADIRAVRGPLSRWRALKSGARCPEVYGDPALVLPRFYLPDVTPDDHVAIVPHYVDHERVVDLYGTADGVRIVNVLGEPERVIDQIRSCRAVVSSSLHGLIVAAAYGIPARWVEFSDGLCGDGTKFFDFYLSGGDRSDMPVDARKTAVPVADLVAGARVPRLPDLHALWEACPFKDAGAGAI